MDNLLDRFLDDMEAAVRSRFPNYFVKISELNRSFFALIKCLRGKIFRSRRKVLYDDLKRVTEDEDVYNKYSECSFKFCMSYFPYFKLVKSYDGYYFHFLEVKKEYESRVDNSRSFYLRTYIYKYFYACPTSYKVYRNAESAYQIYAKT